MLVAGSVHGSHAGCHHHFLPSSTGRPPAGQSGSPGPPRASQISWLSARVPRPPSRARVPHPGRSHQRASAEAAVRRAPFVTPCPRIAATSPSRALSEQPLDTNPTRRQASRRLRQRDDTHGHGLGGAGARTCPAWRRDATRPGGSKPLRHQNAGVRVAGLDHGADHTRHEPDPNNYPHATAARGSDPTTRRRRTLPRPPETRPVGGTGGGWVAGTIDPSCDPTPCPVPPVHPSGRLRPGRRQGKNRARFARFFLPR